MSPNIVQLFASKTAHDLVENEKRKQEQRQRIHRGVSDGVTESASRWVCLKIWTALWGKRLSLGLGDFWGRARARG